MTLLLAIAVFLCGFSLDFQNPEFPQRHRQVFALVNAANTGQFRISGMYTSLLAGYRTATYVGAPQIQHTLLHINCPACELDKAEPDTLAMLPFPEAAHLWLFNHRQYIEPRTARDYEQYIKALTPYFADCRLLQINLARVRIYQRSRSVKAGASRVNMECSTLRQILQDANLELKGYKPLRTNKEGSGRAYTPEMKEAILKAAFSQKRWLLAGHCLRVMLNTGCGFGELSGIRRRDFDMTNRTIYVLVGAKNQDRRRRVPLNSEAFASLCWLHERWTKAGGKMPDHFLLFHRAPNRTDEPDFYRSMGTIKNAFSKIKIAAGIPKEFRVYDCRVTAITETLSSGQVSIHTAKKLYGHVSEEMQKRYYKPDMETLREAVEVLVKKPAANVEKVRTAFTTWKSST